MTHVGKGDCPVAPMRVNLVGVGMGNAGTLTVAAKEAIESSGLLVGASRLLEQFSYLDCEKRALVRSDDIVDALARADVASASVLMSGDVGFYSGAAALYGKLDRFDVEVFPGISSLVYFCAKLRTSWQDAALVSAHGRAHNAVGVIQAHAKTFCIAGGQTKVEDICQDLVDRGLGDVAVSAGERLSYDDERIVSGTAEELARERFDDLSVMLVRNDRPVQRPFGAPSLADRDFERGGVPMTKEEVRALVVAKLRIAPGHVIWDIGAGTGSVSVEMALAANEGVVYAVERNEEGVSLISRACDAHGAGNVRIVHGPAPEALEGLPAPDRVFVGGSSGAMRDIFAVALEANPQVRICATAVTLETLSELLDCVGHLGNAHVDIVQVSVARADELGAYHLMRAENPVFIITAQAGQVA